MLNGTHYVILMLFEIRILESYVMTIFQFLKAIHVTLANPTIKSQVIEKMIYFMHLILRAVSRVKKMFYYFLLDKADFFNSIRKM